MSEDEKSSQGDEREMAVDPPLQRRYYSRNDLEAFNLSHHAVWVFDVERSQMWWANRAALTVWNAKSLESLLERDFADMSTAVEKRLQDHLTVFQTSEEPIHESWTLYPNGKGPKTCNLTLSGIRVDDGRLLVFVECESVEAQDSIDESALRSVEMLRHLPVPVGQFDAHGCVIDQNPESLSVFGGCSHEDHEERKPTIGCCLIERFVDKEMGRRVLEQVVAKGVDFNAEIQQHTTKGLQWFAVQIRRSKDPVSGQPVAIYSARNICAVVKAKKDIKAEQTAKKQAEDANTAKSEFIAVMSHEIRTPLYQVTGFIELLATTQLSDDQKEYVNLMESSASSLMTVINDVMDYTKLEVGMMKMERIPLNVQDVVASCSALVAPKTEAKGLSLTTIVDPDVDANVIGDPNRLRQVLLNLLHNSVKFTQKGGIKVLVSQVAQQGSDQALLNFVVEDTGIGIDSQHQQAVFCKYRQAEASVSRKYGGTGLGLSICKIIVETLGGSIGVSSSLGKGSKFWFRIPFDKCRENTKVTPSGALQSKPLVDEAAPSLNILVAEDNKMSQKLVLAVLKRLGHSAVAVETGLQAVEAVENGHFDLVLMDVQMPEMDGVEATKTIRRRGWTELPVLGLTASFQVVDREKYQAIGMNDCIGKPIRIDDLRQRICSVLT